MKSDIMFGVKNTINFTEEEVYQYISNQYIYNNDIIKFIQAEFKRMSRKSTIIFLIKLLTNISDINAKDFVERPKTFVRYNLGKFEKSEREGNAKLKPDFIKNLKYKLNGFLIEMKMVPIKFQ